MIATYILVDNCIIMYGIASQLVWLLQALEYSTPYSCSPLQVSLNYLKRLCTIFLTEIFQWMWLLMALNSQKLHFHICARKASWGFLLPSLKSTGCPFTPPSPHCISSYNNYNVYTLETLKCQRLCFPFPASTQSFSESFHTVSEHLSKVIVMKFIPVECSEIALFVNHDNSCRISWNTSIFNNLSYGIYI